MGRCPRLPFITRAASDRAAKRAGLGRSELSSSVVAAHCSRDCLSLPPPTTPLPPLSLSPSLSLSHFLSVDRWRNGLRCLIDVFDGGCLYLTAKEAKRGRACDDSFRRGEGGVASGRCSVDGLTVCSERTDGLRWQMITTSPVCALRI